MSDAVGSLANRDLPPLYSSSLQPHGGCANPHRVSGVSAWFLGSQRGTLGWEIRQPPRYYKQLLLITRPASSPLSAHSPTRIQGADNDDVGGNFQFQAAEGRLCLGGCAPSVTLNSRGTAISRAFGDQTLFAEWSLDPSRALQMARRVEWKRPGAAGERLCHQPLGESLVLSHGAVT